MDLRTAPGALVRLVSLHGAPTCQEHAARHLKVGSVYTVRAVEIGGFSSRVCLEEVPGWVSFNTVLFENVDF